MTEKQVLTASALLAFVVLMQLLCAFVASLLKRPKLVLIANAIVTGTAAGTAAFPFMPSLDAFAMSVFVALAVCGASLHLSGKSLSTPPPTSKNDNRGN